MHYCKTDHKMKFKKIEIDGKYNCTVRGDLCRLATAKLYHHPHFIGFVPLPIWKWKTECGYNSFKRRQ